MSDNALGLIETRGLVAAIEAADTMVKAAHVELVGAEKTLAALMTIKIRGEVGAVRAALDAGSKAANAIGELVSCHIIPRPHEDTQSMVYGDESGGNPKSGELTLEEVMAMPVRQLRKVARDLPGFPIQGREISMANKEGLIEKFKIFLSG